MATDHLQIPDIAASQNQKEVTANAAHNLLDRAMNQHVDITVAAGANALTTTQARENGIILAGGTPGAPWTFQMPDTNERMLTVYNGSDDQGTIQNSAAGGTGQPVIQVGEATIFHYDGVNFIDITDAVLAATSWVALTDTPSALTGQSGMMTQVNLAETAIEFIMQTMKQPVVAATTVNGDLATVYENGDIIDGVTLATGDRILLKNQSTGAENGVYVVNASGAPTRAADFDDDIDLAGGVMVPVNNEGTVNGDTIWVLSDDDVVSVGVDSLVFVQFGSVATFSGLSDTPSSMTGESGTRLTPNNAETALVYEGTPWKDPVVVATTAALTLSTDVENGDTIDGVVLVTGDRVLIKNQASGAENGIYTVNASSSPTRADDFDDDKDAVLGCVVAVNEGTANAQTLWQMTNITAVTIGSTVQTWAAAGGGGGVNRWTEVTVQTTDDTTDDTLIALASGDATVVRGFGVGIGPSGVIGFNWTIVAENAAGTSAEIGTAQIYTADGTAAAYTFDVDVDDTGDDIRIRLNGAAAETVNWTFQYELITET